MVFAILSTFWYSIYRVAGRGFQSRRLDLRASLGAHGSVDCLLEGAADQGQPKARQPSGSRLQTPGLTSLPNDREENRIVLPFLLLPLSVNEGDGHDSLLVARLSIQTWLLVDNDMGVRALVVFRWSNVNRWFEALEMRETYMATKSDFYTHAKDIPPQ